MNDAEDFARMVLIKSSSSINQDGWKAMTEHLDKGHKLGGIATTTCHNCGAVHTGNHSTEDCIETLQGAVQATIRMREKDQKELRQTKKEIKKLDTEAVRAIKQELYETQQKLFETLFDGIQELEQQGLTAYEMLKWLIHKTEGDDLIEATVAAMKEEKK